MFYRQQKMHELRHHAAADLRRLFQVARCAGGELAQIKLLRGMTAQPHRHEVHQLAVSLQIVLFRRQGQRVAARLPARDDGNQVHLVAVGQDVPDDGVTRLVDGDHALVALW